jgi:hypothetical protein
MHSIQNDENLCLMMGEWVHHEHLIRVEVHRLCDFPLFKRELFSVDQTNIGQKLDLLICSSPHETF